MAPTSIPARSGATAHLQCGQRVKISNPHGTQVVDMWAFAALPEDISEERKVFYFKYLSMIHTRSALAKVTLGINDVLRDNEREPLLTVVDDTCGGVHCTLFAACDRHRFRQLGAEGHGSCGDNMKGELVRFAAAAPVVVSGDEEEEALRVALDSASRAVAEGWLPDPVNWFMNVPVSALEEGQGGNLRLSAPTCPRGGYVVLRAEVECVVVMSACPMDLGPAGAYQNPGAEFEILL